MKLSKGAQRALREAERCDRHGWMFGSGGEIRKRDVKALVTAGLADDGGWASMVDGDGWTIQPERERPCWKLTAAGRAELQRRREADWAPVSGEAATS